MQKKLIALALASLAGSAFAQSNVTIYGIADGAFEYASATGASTINALPAADAAALAAHNLAVVKGATKGDALDVKGRTRFNSNSSYIGFKGVEDLGNGLKALWQFESGIDFTDGANGGYTLASRDSFVGLTGNFGTVVGGNLTHPIRAMGAKFDSNPGGSSLGFTGAIFGEVGGVKTGTDDRAKNAVAYVSPNFSGFTATAAYVSGEQAKNDTQNPAGSYMSHQWQVAGQYENGPIYVGVGYHEANNPQVLGAVLGAVNLQTAAAATTSNDKLKAWRAVGTYTFPTNTKVGLIWDQQKYSFDFNSGAVVPVTMDSDVKRTAWGLSLSQGIGKHTVYVQYVAANDLKLGGDKMEDTGAKMWNLGYTYELSKRTMVRAYYAELKNKEGAKYDFYNNPTGNSWGGDPKGFGLGLRHSF